MTDSNGLRTAWLEHPFFKYRGCAADADDPRRMAGNPELPVGAHHAPDAWVPERQAVRVAREDAAIEVCLGCPVMVQCDAYASSVSADGRLAEPDGVWGGRRALERHRALIATRHAVPAAPDRRFHTKQKQAVLRAFATCWDPYEVAAAAGLDVRTANWQRARMTTDLGLPHDASRAEFLATAAGRGLLEGLSVVADDGSVPAVAPPTKVPAPAPVSEPRPGPVPMPAGPMPDGPPPVPMPAGPVPDGPPPVPMPSPEFAGDQAASPRRVPAPRRDRFTDIDGQLALWEAELVDLAPVHNLFPAEPLEAAA